MSEEPDRIDLLESEIDELKADCATLRNIIHQIRELCHSKQVIHSPDGLDGR